VAVFRFSTLSDGQSLAFNPNADVLNFDQTTIAAADLRVTQVGTNTRIEVVSGQQTGKDVTLTNVSQLQLATTNVTFADASRLLFGDNSTAQNDNLANSLTGTAGRDLLQGFGGADTMNGGAGDDTYIVSTGDVLSDSGGVDTVVTDVNWTLATGFENITMAGTGNLIATGNNGGNFAIGNSGDNYFNMRAGDDTIQAGAGNDWIDMSAFGTESYGNDMIDGGAGTDTVNFAISAGQQSAVNVDLTSGLFNGGGLNGVGGGLVQNVEHVVGAAFNDSIKGAAAAETLEGREGNDTLSGMGGNDTLVGGTGQDTFVFAAAPGVANADLVSDFVSGTDKLAFDNSAFAALGTAGAFAAGDGRFAAGAGFTSGRDASDRLVYNTTTGQLFYDADGNGAGASQLVATLQGAPGLTASDIVVTGQPNTIVGTAGDDSLTGTQGDDSIDGGDGNDTLDGGAGNDSLSGGTGSDLIIGGDGNDALGGEPPADFGPPRPPSVDTMNGGLGDDSYSVNHPNDVLIDAGGIDTVFANDTDWTLGAGFENLFISNAFTESGFTGIGNDLDNVMSNGNRLEGLGGNDTLFGSAARDLLIGGDGNDSLHGAGSASGGLDTLDGGAGNDTLDGESGAVLLFSVAPGAANADLVKDFGSGRDVIQLDASVHANAGVSGRFATGDARFFAAAGATGGHDADDRVIYNTTTGQLFYDADGNGAGASQLIATLQGAPALAASDIFVAPQGTSIIIGTPFDDSLIGTPGNDSILGLAGNDRIEGREGNDTLEGGAGNDDLSGWDGSDQLFGGDGNDTLAGGLAEPRDSSADTLNGGLGDDLYVVDTSNDVLSDAGGIDTVEALDLDWTLGAGFENLALNNDISEFPSTGIGNDLDNVMSITFAGGHLEGRGGNDTLLGSGRSDALLGQDGNDSIDGRGGSDTIEGGAGIDTLTGHGDANFVFSAAPGAANADLITDFGPQDTIRLDARVMTNLGASGRFAAGDGRFFAAAGATGGHDTDDRVIYNTSTGQLFYDADGSGAGSAQLIATLQGAPTLVATSITVDNAPGGQTITGTAGNDSITGTPNNDSIDGLAGNDTIDGAGGDDTLLGGAGNDSLTGSGGADSMVGGDGDDTLDAASDALGPSGVEPGTTPGDTLDGGLGNDEYLVRPNDVVVDPGGIDTIFTDRSDYTLQNGLENLTFLPFPLSQFDGEGVSVRFAGNDLDNVIRIDRLFINGHAQIDGGGGNDLLIGGASSDNLSGGVGNDTLDGGGGGEFGDALSGGDGSDRLISGGNFNFFSGGAGADSFVLTGMPSEPDGQAQVLDFVSGVDKIVLDGAFHNGVGSSGNFAAGDGRFFAAAGAASGHDGDDRVIYDTSTGNLWFDADGNGAGEARLIANLDGAPALAATDIAVENGDEVRTFTGTAGNDSLTGTELNDSISGLAGNDTLNGLGGNDTLDGGAGIDTMNGGFGSDTYIVTAGDVLTDTGNNDTVVSDVDWTLGADFENLTMTGTGNISGTGNNGANLAIGNSGNNYFNMRAGNDTIQGGAGNDWIDMSAFGTASYGDDVIDGGAGTDTVNFAISAGQQSAIVADLTAGTIRGGGAGGVGSATVTGIERVIGAGFSDSLKGSAAAETLEGREGNDTLSGMGGNDTLVGGAGSDSFVFAAAPGAGNVDSITDFVSGADKAAFDNAVFTALGADGNFAAGDARFAAGAGFTSGHDASDRIVYNTTTGQLFYDADGSGAGGALLIATFQGAPAIAATDITVI